jgi:hypothetical protein
MSKTTIAPVLTSLVARRDGLFGVYHPEADREFRALLAVVRVARKHRTEELSRETCTCCAWWCPEIDKALARLERASGGKS